MSIMELYISLGILACLAFSKAENTITFDLMEEQPISFLVGNLATESGLGSNMTSQEFDNLRYSFLDQTNMQNLFDINDKTGDVKTKIQIDREKECEFTAVCVLTFDIAIHSLTVPTFFNIYSVQITLNDKNDNSPTFPTSVIDREIIESSVIGSSLSLPDASDEDSSPQFSIEDYELIPANGMFGLEVTPKKDGGSWLYLVLQKTLDRETLDNYQLQVVAKDGGNPQNVGFLTVNIIVTDYNDNAPIFIQDIYNISIPEETAPNTAILAVSATDKDIGDNGKIIYRFSSRPSSVDSITDLFTINETSGFLTVIGNLGSEAGKTFQIYVDASDQGTSPKSTQATIYINILDTGNNKPEIRINFLLPGSDKVVNISESTNIATVVASLNVEDPDKGPNGNVSCQVSGDFLSLQPITSKKGYLIMIKKKFDREKQDYHNILVTCQDQGSPIKSTTETFHVRVIDDNDCPPEFLQATYFAEIEENNRKGAFITKVSARDDDLSPNNAIQYFLGSDGVDKFSISSGTGVITANQPFDRETALNYKFTVLAEDSGNPSLTGSTSVILTIKDKNDNAPYFDVPFFQFFIKENSPSGVTVGTVTAHDKDDGRNKDVLFSLTNANMDPIFPFLVLPNGDVNTNMPLDREKQSSYEFLVTAKDQGYPQKSSNISVKVYVSDDNDISPNITFPNNSNYTVKIPYSANPGTIITKVTAVDHDETGPNSELSYRFKSGNEDDVFMIGSKTGIVVLKRTYEITKDKDFYLVVEVRDNGKKPLNSTHTLKIVLLFANLTVSQQESGNGNRNIIISIVVIAMTIIISAAMIAIILVLRFKDRQDRKQQNSKPLTFPQILPQEKVRMNSSGSSKDEENMQIKKKKEVSFSIDEDMENMELCNTTSTTNSMFSDYEKLHGKYKVGRRDLHVELPEHKDNLSELSDEATNSDSGHGSSDVDLTHHSNSGAHGDIKINYAPKSVRLQPMLAARCQSPLRADDVLTIVSNNSNKRLHNSVILDDRNNSHDSGQSSKGKDKWVPSYV